MSCHGGHHQATQPQGHGPSHFATHPYHPYRPMATPDTPSSAGSDPPIAYVRVILFMFILIGGILVVLFGAVFAPSDIKIGVAIVGVVLIIISGSFLVRYVRCTSQSTGRTYIVLRTSPRSAGGCGGGGGAHGGYSFVNPSPNMYGQYNPSDHGFNNDRPGCCTPTSEVQPSAPPLSGGNPTIATAPPAYDDIIDRKY